jgi:hypothetical protein
MSLSSRDLYNLRQSKKSVNFAQNSSTSGRLFKYLGGNALLTNNMTFEDGDINSQIFQEGEFLNIRTSDLNIGNNDAKILSKGLTGDQGYIVGRQVTKDMDETECDALPAESAPFNVAIGREQFIASYWRDWGNDVFDGWGFFYIFDVATRQYYFPILSPVNLDDGIFTTQTFNAFGRAYTITHGYPAQGIFKFDVRCSDSSEFIFGAYGDMGSDDDTINTNFTQEYTLNGNPYTLYYNRNIEDGDLIERFFSYFIPHEAALNNAKTYNDYLDYDELSLFSVPVRYGITVYFSKMNDVKDWVINDLQVDTTNVFINGNVVVNGSSLSRLNVTNLIDEDYLSNTSALINGYFTSSTMNGNRNFTLPTAYQIISEIANCITGTSFKFTINNVQANNHNRIIVSPNSSVILSPSCFTTSVGQNKIISYICVVTNITEESEQVVIYQENNF